MSGSALQVDAIIGPAGDLQCEAQALLVAECVSTTSEFDDEVPAGKTANDQAARSPACIQDRNPTPKFHAQVSWSRSCD